MKSSTSSWQWEERNSGKLSRNLRPPGLAEMNITFHSPRASLSHRAPSFHTDDKKQGLLWAREEKERFGKHTAFPLPEHSQEL